eukprot:304474_1
MSPLAIFFIWYAFTFKLPSAIYLNCRTWTSSRSAQEDGSKAKQGCPSHRTLVSCGFYTSNWDQTHTDGAYIQDGICYAINGRRDGSNGHGVFAVARCCDFSHHDLSCIAVTGAYATGDDVSKSASCGSPYRVLIGCTAQSPWSTMDGCYPGTTNPRSTKIISNFDYDFNPYMVNNPYSDCTAVNGASGGGTKGEAMCCGSSSYALECAVRYGSKSGLYDRTSKTTCSRGYSMVSCSGYGSWQSINAWYISSVESDTCIARTFKGSSYVYAIGICCKHPPTHAPTSAPTPAPTHVPTISPTSMPTWQPTGVPTVNPTVEPTSEPSSTPTDAPSNQPTSPPTDQGGAHESTKNAGKGGIQWIVIGVGGGACVCCMIIAFIFDKRKTKKEKEDAMDTLADVVTVSDVQVKVDQEEEGVMCGDSVVSAAQTNEERKKKKKDKNKKFKNAHEKKPRKTAGQERQGTNWSKIEKERAKIKALKEKKRREKEAKQAADAARVRSPPKQKSERVSTKKKKSKRKRKKEVVANTATFVNHEEKAPKVMNKKKKKKEKTFKNAHEKKPKKTANQLVEMNKRKKDTDKKVDDS